MSIKGRVLQKNKNSVIIDLPQLKMLGPGLQSSFLISQSALDQANAFSLVICDITSSFEVNLGLLFSTDKCDVDTWIFQCRHTEKGLVNKEDIEFVSKEGEGFECYFVYIKAISVTLENLLIIFCGCKFSIGILLSNIMAELKFVGDLFL